ncbi:hypothetical protein PAMA_002070 [Pampus argenteus]
MDLDIRQYLTKANEHQDSGALQSAYSLITEMAAAGSGGRTPRAAPELYVLCAEAALQLRCLEISAACLKMYFEGNPPANQFLCRAYLCQGRQKSPPATGSVEDFEEAVLYFLKAIELSKHEPRYHFMVFNTSVLYFQTVCPLLQPGRRLHLVSSLRQVVQSLEEVADQDHSWRAELMMHLIESLVDSGKMEDAGSFGKVTEEFIKTHTPHLYPKLFTLLVQHKLLESNVLFEMSRQCTALAVIYKIQQFKRGLKEINEDELAKKDSAELEEIFHQLADTKASTSLQITPIQPADRVAFLLELAVLALQVKHQKVAANCLKKLKSMGEASISQRIIMECVNCEINLLKKEAKMNDYSKASVEGRLKEIGKLDQLLQTAVREGDPQSIQAVCATQWSFCLPLLQHNLRKQIKTPLLRVAQVLEDIQSMLLEMRCQVHSELAVIEEEEGRLEASLTHLQKAMLLDNGTQRESLSSAFHLLQLRQTLYQTPSRAEDKAAMLLQQARDMKPEDNTDSRPTLVAVGLLLAPADFQMVLDADNTSKIPVGSIGSGPAAQLSAEAQHYSTSVQKVDGHLARQAENTDNTERDWIQALSDYATSSFLRAAELGAEIRESWLAANAAIYLWNYSRHLLAAGEYQRLLPTFQKLVEMPRETEYTGNRPLFVLLCDAVARGLIQHLCGPDSGEPALTGDMGKKRAEKGMEKAASVQGVFLDPAALHDVRKALELCNYALRLSNCNISGETVPIAARKQVVATWVQLKRLLHQQIGSKLDTEDECTNEEVLAMTRVLVGVEMLQCNSIPRHMEFSVPSLSTLVSMASECSWSDAVVELQVWCQLASFCHYANDHSLVLCCTKNALQLEEAAAKCLSTMSCVLYGLSAVNEMLSSAACLSGLSLIHESDGDLHSYREAMNMLLFSVSYAEKAKNPALCVAASRHYWNTCLPLTHTPEQRCQLKEPLEKILSALVNTNTKHSKSAETQWQKISLLLEFGEWLYCHNFPKEDAQQQVQWAIDVILHLEAKQTERPEDELKAKNTSSEKCESLVGIQGSSFTQSLSNLTEVQRLDSLVRAHTLLAVMADRTSPEYQLNLLRAYTFVLLIWQVSMAVVCEISSDLGKSQPPQPPPSAGSKKDKGKGKKVKDTQSLFYLNLLEKELHSLSLSHLTLPILHLAEAFAHDLLDRRSLSDLYRLRIVRTCCLLGMETHSPYHEKLLNLSRIQEQEQMGSHKAIVLSQERRSFLNQKAKTDEIAASWRPSMDVCAQNIWLDKAEVCLNIGLYQPARQLLAEAHLVAVELGDQIAMARSLLSLAILACDEQNHAQALILLDKAQALGGDEEFWYQLTLTKVRAVVDQGDQDAQAKIDQIIKQGCGALKLALKQRVNRHPKLTFLITTLEMRGAIECIHATDSIEPGETHCTEVVPRLIAACDTLRQCASGFTKLNYREQAAKSNVECAHGLRILARYTTDAQEKRRFLLDGLSHMQFAITEQEHVVLNAQSLFPTQEESHGLLAMRRLLHLRLALAEFCLKMLEEHCEEDKHQALAQERMTSAEIALEEYTRCTPEPNSIEQEWMSVGSTLGQMVLSQLAAVSSHSLDNMEKRAHCLGLIGKNLRLLAAKEDPIYLSALWGRDKRKEAWSNPKVTSGKEEDSEKEKDRESSRKEPRMTSAKTAELQQRRHKAQQLLAQARKALAEAVSLCLQHKLPAAILADASLNMLECHGQSDPGVAGQYLALFQSCCTVAVMAEVLNSSCADTSVSQLSALLSLRRKLLLSEEEEWPSSMLKGVEDSLNSFSKAFSQLTINPNHLNILPELPPNLKILLLQHSEDGSELYGAFYEMTKAPENQKGKTMQVTGTLTCSRVAKISVCPGALLALRKQIQAFGQETRHALLKEACWQSAEGRQEAPEEHQKTAAEKKLAPSFRQIAQDMEDYLNPLLTQFDFSCLRPQAASVTVPDMTKTKDKEEKGSLDEPGEFVMLLADRKLQELPLEALSFLQEEGLSSVSRDFSLQLLHSRLHREEPEKVESDNKNETKGGKGTKGKGDQSQAIKAKPANCVLPPNTFPVNTRNFKYIVDPYNEGNFEGTSLSKKMEEILETHSQHFTHLWEGFMGSKQTPSLSEIEQLLSRCGGFIYLGTERFMANITPAKLAALNLSECHMALIFDLVQNNASILRQANLDMRKSAGQFALEKPLETALLMSLDGVRCIVLNQWHSSLQHNTRNMVTLLDNLLGGRQTSGQIVHVLRKRDKILTEDDLHHKTTLTPSAFNCILYGLPNLIVT